MIGAYCQVGDLIHIPQGTKMSERLIDGTFARFGYTKNPCKGILLGHQHGPPWSTVPPWLRVSSTMEIHFAKIYFIDDNYPNKIAYVESKNIYKLKRRNYVSKDDTSDSRCV